MKKEEILAKSRRENKGRDIVELEVENEARGFAGASAMLIGTAVYFAARHLYDYRLPGFWVIFCGYFGVWGITRFLLGRRRGLSGRKRILWLFYGLLMLLLTANEIIVLFEMLKAGKL